MSRGAAVRVDGDGGAVGGVAGAGEGKFQLASYDAIIYFVNSKLAKFVQKMDNYICP